jgi:hypothetical protein
VNNLRHDGYDSAEEGRNEQKSTTKLKEGGKKGETVSL